MPAISSIVEAAALLRLADLFVGPDSGPMNLAAAGETPAFTLFGATPVLSYSRFIHAIEPEGGQSPDGMARITPGQVMARIEPYLISHEISALSRLAHASHPLPQAGEGKARGLTRRPSP